MSAGETFFSLSRTTIIMDGNTELLRFKYFKLVHLVCNLEMHLNLRDLPLTLPGTISKKERSSKVHISGQVSPTATKQIQLKRYFLYGQQPLAGPLPVYVPPVTRWNSEIMRQERGDNRGFVAQRTARPSAQSIPSLPGVSSKVTQFHYRGAEKTQPRETNKSVLPDIIHSTNGNESWYVT